MKDKIFNALKQEYSYLGLGDALLQAQAESLANLGFVTDENLDAVVKAQAAGLKAYQAANDKRVADALSKENAKSAKDKENAAKQTSELQSKIDELAKQAEADKSTLAKQAEELKAAQELQKQLDELKAKTEQQNAEYEKRKADLLAFITGAPQQPQTDKQPAPVQAQVPQPQPEPKQEPKQQQPTFDEAAFQKKLEKEWAKKFETVTNANGTQIQQMLEANKQLAEQVQALVRENTEYKAAKAAENRRNFILNKAHELGIPEWRINEGFSIADNADETAITNTLTTVSNNIRANVLPQNGVNMPNLGGNNNPDTSATIDAIAAQLVQTI